MDINKWLTKQMWRTNPPHRRISNNVHYFPLQQVELNPHAPWVRAGHPSTLKRQHMQRKKQWFSVEKPDPEHLNQGTEVNITSDVMWGSFISEMIGEGHFTFVVFFPKHLLPQRNHAKKDKINLRDILQYTCMHLKTVSHKEYSRLRNNQRPQENKTT